MKICIDAGHGGYQVGRVGVYSNESDLNLIIAKRLEIELRKLGHHTIMTRRSDIFRTLHFRSSFANRYNASLFVSIHCNAGRGGDIDSHGIETFVFTKSKTARRWANSVQRRLIRYFPTHRNRRVKTSSKLYVLKKTKMPAILVECEFLSNPRMEHFLNDPVNQHMIAIAIADGIDEQAEK